MTGAFTAFAIYLALFFIDFGKVKNSKNDKHLFLTEAAIGAAAVILAVSGKAPITPAAVVKSVLDFLGIHY